jgi:hypothetical protein
MKNAQNQEVEFDQVTEYVDASGNKQEVKKGVKALAGKALKDRVKAIRAKQKVGEELDSDDEELCIEHDL